ncbi:MAG: hemolysin III family protein [Deltaproteobacteria bacterium]|nr:hemolysin III family protein [Nannocystaceae bacterium]
MALTAPSARPKLRGVSHQIAFYLSLVSGVVLIASSGSRRAIAVNAIYATFLAGMFGVSAILHRRDWGPRAFGWLRRADHAMIFACIAGTYTPFCALGLDSFSGTRLLILVWSAAGLGILRAVLWPHAPRVVTSALYVAVGWAVLAYLPEVHAALSPLAFALLVIGGSVFTVGAAVYLFRWPDPWPMVFGYHEVFHVLIILGCSCHFAAIEHVALTR